MKFLKNHYFYGSITIIFYILIVFVIGNYLYEPILNLTFKYNDVSFLVTHFSNCFFRTNLTNYINDINTLYQLFTYSLILIFIISFLVVPLKKDIESFKPNKDKLMNTLIIAFFLYYGVNIIVNIITLMANNNVESINQNNIETMINSNNVNTLIMFITTVFLGPLSEELVFRKAIFSVIPHKMIAAIISCLIFGFLHTITYDYNFSDLLFVTLPYIASGISFCFLYYKTDNVIICYILHAVLNFISFTIILL